MDTLTHKKPVKMWLRCSVQNEILCLFKRAFKEHRFLLRTVTILLRDQAVVRSRTAMPKLTLPLLESKNLVVSSLE